MPVRLTVITDRDPLARPELVKHCREGVRPCPFVSCRHNLLVDVLEGGELVLNYPSRRLTGADRTIADKHENERQWFVIVKMKLRRKVTPFALGPCDTPGKAKQVAAAWIEEHGARTAEVVRVLPPSMQIVGDRRDGALDGKFEAEAEDAVEYWFDEPNATMPSCVLDEVARLENDKRDDDDGYLLEQIAQVMRVTRERVRQVELIAVEKFRAACLAAGISAEQLLNSGGR
jgi:hypothetical protein